MNITHRFLRKDGKPCTAKENIQCLYQIGKQGYEYGWLRPHELLALEPYLNKTEDECATKLLEIEKESTSSLAMWEVYQ